MTCAKRLNAEETWEMHVIIHFRCFTYVTTHSPTLLSLLLRHKLFTYVTWRAAHGKNEMNVSQTAGDPALGQPFHKTMILCSGLASHGERNKAPSHEINVEIISHEHVDDHPDSSPLVLTDLRHTGTAFS